MKYLIFLATLLSFSIVQGQEQTITVLNSKTKKPIEGVSVYSSNFSTSTDKEGKLVIPVIVSSDKVTFHHPSYINLKISYKNIWAQGYRIFMVEDPIKLDEIVISANRRQQSKTEVPNSIISIEKTDVELQNVQTAADLLETKGGVFIQKSQMGGGSPMIRGFSANRLLLVVDGIRMNNAIYRNGNLHNVISLDAGTIDHTEVIFGPGSVMYGSDALGGVISFQTLKPKLTTSKLSDQSGNFFARYSSANFEKTGHGDFNFGTERWAALVSLTFSDYGDMVMGENGPDEYLKNHYVVENSFINGKDQMVENGNPRKQIASGYNQINYMHKLRFRPNDKIELNYAYHYSNTSDIPRYDRLIQYKGSKLKYAEWYYGPQLWRLHLVEMDYHQKHKLLDRANVVAGWQTYEESRFERKLNDPLLLGRVEKLDIFSLNMDIDKSINSNNHLYYGVETNHNLVHSSGHSRNISNGKKEVISSRYPDGSTTSSIAAYLSYKLNITKKFTLQAGSRYTRTHLQGEFDLNFFRFPFKEFNNTHHAVTENLGMVYHPTSNWQVNLSACTGFRSPNIDDIAKVFDSTPGNVVVPNPELEPEKARNIEMGILRKFGNRAKLEIDVFYTYLHNAMVRRDFTLNGEDSIMYNGELSKVEALVNTDYAHIYGGSATFDLIINPKLKIHNSFTATWGKDSDGFTVRHVAPLFGTSHLVYGDEIKTVDLYINYNGEVSNEKMPPTELEKPEIYAIDDNGKPYSPAWYTLNLKTSYKLNDHIRLNLGLENILNKRYRPYSSGIVSAGRNLVVSVKASF